MKTTILSREDSYLVNGKTYSWGTILAYRVMLNMFLYRPIELKILLASGKTLTIMSKCVFIDLQNNQFIGKEAIDEFLKLMKKKNNHTKIIILFKREIFAISIAIAIILLGIILSVIYQSETIRFIALMIGGLILVNFSQF